jgi:hypothetical protein
MVKPQQTLSSCDMLQKFFGFEFSFFLKAFSQCSNKQQHKSTLPPPKRSGAVVSQIPRRSIVDLEASKQFQLDLIGF